MSHSRRDFIKGVGVSAVALTSTDLIANLLAQSPREFDLSGYVRFWLETGPRATGNLRVQVDIDPQSFL